MSLDNYVANYNSIGSAYSSFAGEREEEIVVLEQLILPNLCKGAHILDIGCASGRTVKQLNIRGYQTTGIDISEELLRIARSNAPDSKFILGDIRELELQPIYDAVISVDVFCHILNLEELTIVFQKVHSAMHNNGIFAFSTPVVDYEMWETTLDGNTPNFEFAPKCDVSDQYVYLEIYYTYNKEERIREVKFTALKLINEVWQRSDSTALAKDYFKSEIKSALVNAGFIEINEYDSKDIKDFEGVDRVIFFCRKPSVS